MNGTLDPPTIEDLTLLWEAIDTTEDATGEDVSEERAAHARVLNYLYENGVFERPAAT